ncbi:MAG: hypothetical protein ABUK01_16825 [Leptospirales bacterium]
MMEDLIKTPLGRKSLTGAFAALIIILCLNGVLQSTLDTVFFLDKIQAGNDDFLKTSFGMATKYFASLSIVKGILAIISSTQLNLVVVKSDIGKIFISIEQTIDAIWQFFGYSMVSITVQMVLLKFFKYISLKILAPVGAFFIGISIFNLKMLRKLGLLLIATGLILYIAMPFTIYTSRAMFDEFAMDTSMDLDEKIGILKLETNDLSHGITTDVQIKQKGMFVNKLESFKAAINGSVDIMTTAAIKHLGTLMIMFIVTPLFFYGILYLVYTRVRNYIEGDDAMPDRIDEYIYNKTAAGFGKLDKGVKKVFNKAPPKKTEPTTGK